MIGKVFNFKIYTSRKVNVVVTLGGGSKVRYFQHLLHLIIGKNKIKKRSQVSTALLYIGCNVDKAVTEKKFQGSNILF